MGPGATERRQFEALFDGVDALVWRVDADGEIRYAGPSHARLLGRIPDRASARSLVHPDDLPVFVLAHRRAIDEGSARCSLRVETVTGGWLRVDGRFARVDEETSRSALFIGHPAGGESASDLFRVLSESVPGVVYLCRNDPTWSMLFLSDDVLTLTGYPATDFLDGRISFVDLFHPDDAPQIAPAVQAALLERVPFKLAYRLRHRDGSLRNVEEYGQGVYNRDGELEFLEGTLFDVTSREVERRRQARFEESLAQMRRTEGLTALAAGVAHQYNNLLAGVIGAIELARVSVDDPGRVAALLDQALVSATRAGDLTRQLVTYASRGTTDPGTVDVGHFLRDLEVLLRASIPPSLGVEVDTGDEPLPVYGDPGQVQQIVMNLAVNARDAAAPGGRIRVTARASHLDEVGDPDLALPAALPAGEYARIEVIDDGPGLADEARVRAFEPFYTTREGRSGLGLAAVSGAVLAHHGGIAIDSTPGRTVFRVYLPLAVAIAPPAARPERAPGGTECVLVVEDDPVLRHVATLALESLGYRVLVAADGSEGLDLLKQALREVDLLFTDASMPGLDGAALVAAARAIRDDLPVIVTSGYGEGAVRADLAAAGVRFLQKPYRVEALAALVREVLEG